jgi:hypothetical protein
MFAVRYIDIEPMGFGEIVTVLDGPPFRQQLPVSNDSVTVFVMMGSSEQARQQASDEMALLKSVHGNAQVVGLIRNKSGNTVPENIPNIDISLEVESDADAVYLVDGLVSGLTKSVVNYADYSDFVISTTDASNAQWRRVNTQIDCIADRVAEVVHDYIGTFVPKMVRVYTVICSHDIAVNGGNLLMQLITDLEAKFVSAPEVQWAGNVYVKEVSCIDDLDVTLIMSTGPSLDDQIEE